MDQLSLVLGSILIFITIVDLLWTSLWIDAGAGPLTRAVTSFGWRSIRTVSFGKHRYLASAGPIILTLTVSFWVLAIWLGWLLIFASDSAAVVGSSNDEPANLAERIYFVGYTLFTLGNGDFKPGPGSWQILTSVASGTGLLAVTLAITYLLSVVSAGVSGRALAANVSSLGTPDQALAGSWNGKTYEQLAWCLQPLSSDLAVLGQRYLAYPVLQYFHSSKADTSPIVAVVRLEQLLALAGSGVPAETRPPAIIINSLRSSIEDLLDILPSKFTAPAEQTLTLPHPDELRAIGAPVETESAFTANLQSRDPVRRRLCGLLKSHGWLEAF